MVKSFVHKGLEDYYYDGTKKGIKPQHAQNLADILDRLDAAINIKDMNYPGSGLHKLKGRKKGIWAVKVTGNWRVTFSFIDGNAEGVDYLDYH